MKCRTAKLTNSNAIIERHRLFDVSMLLLFVRRPTSATVVSVGGIPAGILRILKKSKCNG